MGTRLCFSTIKDEDIPYVSKELINYGVLYNNKLMKNIYNKYVIFDDNKRGIITNAKWVNSPPHISLIVVLERYGIRQINLDQVSNSNALFSKSYNPILDLEHFLALPNY